MSDEMPNFGRRSGAVAMRFSLGRQATKLNILGLLVLFVGYFLTGGTELIDSDLAKTLFRLIALALFAINILLGRTMRTQHLLMLFLFYAALSLNQSQIAQNVIYLLIISASLSNLSEREAVTAILISSATVVALHLFLLSIGGLAVQLTDFAGRERSTLGFLNANQAAAIYLSLVISSYLSHILRKTRTSFFLMALSFLTAFIAIQHTESRTSLFGLILTLALYLVERAFYRQKLYRSVLRLCAAATPAIATAITYYLTTSHNASLNVLLSFRPYFFEQFLKGVQPIEMLVGWSPSAGVDNLYLMLLSGAGAIGYLVLVVWVSYKTFSSRIELLPIIIVLLVVSVFEGYLVRPEIPLSVVFLQVLFSRTSRRVSPPGGMRR